MSGAARYVFAVARRLGSGDLGTATGFHGVPLEIVEHAGALGRGL